MMLFRMRRKQKERQCRKKISDKVVSLVAGNWFTMVSSIGSGERVYPGK